MICCERVPSYRSGWAWNHAADCPDYPGQPVGMERTVERTGGGSTGNTITPRRSRKRRGWWSPVPFAGKAAEVVAWKARHR